ncbi:phosphoribosylanthranilate isomerase [Candidatus Bipolaricaulota bacterium]|nr:phosphoribosylanthranilate isomerase [Candidatus Bipolaricaulota bacterium]
MVRVKICGLRGVEDLIAARGADAVGVIVATPASRRNLSLEAARRVLSSVPPGVLRVAVTTCTSGEELSGIVAALAPDVLQVHRELPPEGWERLREEVPGPILWGLLGVGGAALARAEGLRRAPLDGVVLDTVHGGRTGGTGIPHDWGLSRRLRELLRPLPVILAGGITPDNALQAIRTVAPDWIDVSSGVEEGGRKSQTKVAKLLSVVKDEAK